MSQGQMWTKAQAGLDDCLEHNGSQVVATVVKWFLPICCAMMHSNADIQDMLVRCQLTH